MLLRTLYPNVGLNDLNIIFEMLKSKKVNIIYYMKLLGILYFKLLEQEGVRSLIIEIFDTIGTLLTDVPLYALNISLRCGTKRTNSLTRRNGFLKIDASQYVCQKATVCILERKINDLKVKIKNEKFWVLNRQILKELILKTKQRTIHFSANEKLKWSTASVVKQSEYAYTEENMAKMRALMFGVFLNNRVRKRFVQIILSFIDNKIKANQRISTVEFPLVRTGKK